MVFNSSRTKTEQSGLLKIIILFSASLIVPGLMMMIIAYVAIEQGFDHVTWLKFLRIPDTIFEICSIILIFGIIYQIKKSNSYFSSNSDSRKNVVNSTQTKYVLI